LSSLITEAVLLTTIEHRWFLKINPNGRIPALTDGSQRVFESGSIMLYLADKYDTDRKISYAPGTPEYFEQVSWLMFQIGGIGPMQGMLERKMDFSGFSDCHFCRPSKPLPTCCRRPLRLQHQAVYR